MIEYRPDDQIIYIQEKVLLVGIRANLILSLGVKSMKLRSLLLADEFSIILPRVL